MANWRSWGFWLGPISLVVYGLFVLFIVPYVIYSSVHDGFTKEEQLVLIGGMFVLASVPISVWLIYRHLIHFNRPNLQKPIIRILWMVPIYALNAWLALVLPPSYTIYLDSIRECYEAYVIYNFMVYLLEALCLEMDLHAVMREKPQVHHRYPFCCLRNWDMGTEFVYKCKHGILQYAFFQPIITVISLICELFGVYGKGTISMSVAYPYLVFVTNISQAVAMYCLILFYLANRSDLAHMRPLPKFACIKAVIFFSFFQGMVINVLVYFKVIKNIFGTNEQDDYQILSEKLQNFLICIEMVVAALAHHYSYPYQEHQINIPNYRAQNNMRDILVSMFDVDDIYQDMREHWGAVKNSLTRPFRGADPFQESNALLASSSNKSRSPPPPEMERELSSVAPLPGSSKYGTVDYVSTLPIGARHRDHQSSMSSSGMQKTSQHHPQGAPPQFGNMFRGGAGSSRMGSPPSTATTTSSNAQTCKKSDSSNTNSWPMLSTSISSDVVNIEVKGLEENLIQLPDSPSM